MFITNTFKCILLQISFLKFPFCGPHIKPHVARGLGKHPHVHFDTKLVHGTCEIRYIPCACMRSTYTLDKPCTPYVPPHQQPYYKPVKYFT